MEDKEIRVMLDRLKKFRRKILKKWIYLPVKYGKVSKQKCQKKMRYNLSAFYFC